ncbi:MAG TPA: phage BR0599 family protein [Verrucomicrobiae bacterium]|nr:phage BR0599 family protein [Verrucomicrobiae bacterium]
MSIIWKSANFAHGDIQRSLNLEEDVLTLTSFYFAENPLNDDIALRAEAPVTLTIFWADYDGVNLTNVQKMFTGPLSKPSRQGKKFTPQFSTGDNVFDSQVPRLIRGTMCNHLGGANDGMHLVSIGCTGPDAIMLKTSWKCTATVADPVSSAFPYQLNLTGLTGAGANSAAALAGGAVFADWFALGWIEWGAGKNIQRRQIIGSTVPVAGALTLTLHKWFTGAGPASGDAVTFYPGCDGAFNTCKAYDAASNPTGKFGNNLNFGGEPFTPAGNPTLLGAAIEPVQGGKK